MLITRKRLLGAMSPIALMLAGPALAQTATTPPAAAPVATVDADPALWVVKDDDTTIYLFGTVHVLKPGLSWFDEGVKKAFDASKEVVLEIPLPNDAEAQKILLPLVVDPDGPPLTEKLHPEKRAAYAAVLAKLGVPATALDQYYPWFASVTMSNILLLKSGYDPSSGAERAIDAAAKAAGKPVTGLETLEQQIGYFATLPEADQIAFLELGVDDFGDGIKTIDEMVANWTKGDPEALGAVMNRDIDKLPKLYKILLADRNVRWANWIDERMKKPGTVFIAVGAGHLAGKDSVQVQLGTHHLTATRVNY
ncbi:MAG: TraB/GumN family protein [Proteobacteria bacterium ST_bin13]|nr:MAG: TraB/GumN family protein [Proteobacteria bacterium ST_bin13]